MALCGLWQQYDSASQPWVPCVFLFLLRSRRLAAATLCWTSCGLTLNCCGGAGWRTISDVECFHFGMFRAVWTAAAVMAAAFAPAWTRTPGPHLHEDNSAVIFRTEVRTVWRTVVEPWSGKLDLKINEKEDKSGMEEVECGERAVKCQQQ